MRNHNHKERSLRALLIACILHLCLVIVGTLTFYINRQQPFEDLIAIDLIQDKKLKKPRQPLKSPLQKRIVMNSESRSESHPQHLKRASTPNLINETIRQSEQELLHSATKSMSDIETSLPELTTAAQPFQNRAMSISKPVSSPYQATDGAGMDSFRQRVTGTGGDGFHKLESTGTSDIGTVGDSLGKEGSGGSEAGDEKSPFAEALERIAEHIIGTRERDKINVVFVLDTSASMRDNIQQVAENLYSMTDAFDLANLEYHLGMSQFSVRYEGQNLKVRALLPDVGLLRQRMQRTTMSGDEHALDALIDTIHYMEFHADADKYIVLVTDEPATTHFKKDNGYEKMRAKVIDSYQLEDIRVNVLGHTEPFQHQLAEETGGLWQRIPGDIGNAASLPSNRVGNQRFLKLFRDIATDIRRNGGSLLFSMASQFEIILEDDDVPMKKVFREFRKNGIRLGDGTRYTQRSAPWVNNDGALWVITDYANRRVYTIRKAGNKLNVYTGIHPESFNLSGSFTAMSQQRGQRWLLNDSPHRRIYTIRSEKNRLNIYAGGNPGVSSNDTKKGFEPAIDLVVMLDYSRSMGGKSEAILLGLSTLIGRLDILPIKYRIGLIRFAKATDAIRVINGAVITKMPVNEAMLASLTEVPFGGDEHLIDAIVEGVPKVKFSPYASRFLLILTDEPTTGNYSPERAIEICQSLGIRAYVIGHPQPEDFQKMLAEKTGGRFFEMPKHLKKGYSNQ